VHGWRVKGRWTGGGSTAEEEFVVVTTGRESEELLGRSLSHLVDQALRVRPGLSGEVSVELLDAEELPQLAGWPAHAGQGRS
jgi:hypothetical protein